MTAVEQAIVEIAGTLETSAPIHEGLRDYTSLNLNSDAHQEVEAELIIYDRRKGLLDTAIAALEALIQDGYPLMPVRPVSAEALADLQDNMKTIEAAFTQFVANAQATSLLLTPGKVEKKK